MKIREESVRSMNSTAYLDELILVRFHYFGKNGSCVLLEVDGIFYKQE